MLKDLDINAVIDLDTARDVIGKLLNSIETLYQDNQQLKHLNQLLRDELRRLTGEQGKPPIKPSSKGPGGNDISSEKERKKRKQRNKRSKKDRIKTHTKHICRVDRTTLPKDAKFKGYQPVLVQDVIFQAYNTLFLKEKYYSPSFNKTFLAPFPAGYDGEFGPGLKALVPKLYYDADITERKILDLLQDANVQISAGKISGMLIKNHDIFHAEKDALYEAGLNSSPWHHIDDTSMRVNGQNQFCHIVCNPLYSIAGRP